MFHHRHTRSAILAALAALVLATLAMCGQLSARAHLGREGKPFVAIYRD